MIRSVGAEENLRSGTFVVISFGAQSAADADAFEAGIRVLVNVLTFRGSDASRAGFAAGALIGQTIAGGANGGAPVVRLVGGQVRRDFVAGTLPTLAGRGVIWATYGIVCDDVTGVAVSGPPTDQQIARASGQLLSGTARAVGTFAGDVVEGAIDPTGGAGGGWGKWILIGAIIAVAIVAIAIGASAIRKAVK